MGLLLTIEVASEQQVWDLPHSIAILIADASVVAEMTVDGEWGVATVGPFTAALGDRLAADGELINYSVEGELHINHERVPMKVGGGGTASGLQIDGQFWFIESGTGVCTLNRLEYVQGSAEPGTVAETIDIRSWKRVETENHGVWKVRRRTAGDSDQIREVLGWLAKFPLDAEFRMAMA